MINKKQRGYEEIFRGKIDNLMPYSRKLQCAGRRSDYKFGYVSERGSLLEAVTVGKGQRPDTSGRKPPATWWQRHLHLNVYRDAGYRLKSGQLNFMAGTNPATNTYSDEFEDSFLAHPHEDDPPSAVPRKEYLASYQDGTSAPHVVDVISKAETASIKSGF